MKLKSKIREYCKQVHQLQNDQDEVDMLKKRMSFVGLLGLAILFYDFVVYKFFISDYYEQYNAIGFSVGLVVCALFIFVARRLKRAVALKVSAFIFISLFLLLAVWGDLVDNTPYPAFLISYIMALLTGCLIIPWIPYELLPIFIVNSAVFTLHFYHGRSLFLKKSFLLKHAHSFGTSTDYLAGVSTLILAFMICVFIRRYEIHEALKKFNLKTEIQAKNQQMQKELELATRIHSRLIPHSVSTPLADIAVTYVPVSYMGGDYAKFHFIDNNKLIFIISDVTGHGVSAALLVNAFNAEFERLAKEGIGPGILLKKLDEFIIRDFAQTSMYITAFCGLLDYKSRKLAYSNHGHPPQYLYQRKDHSIKRVLAQTSLLGFLKDGDDDFYQDEISFNKGDQILLFTDGIIEAKDIEGTDFGEERIERFMKRNANLSPSLFNDELLNQLNFFTNNKLSDDVFILNIKTNR